MTRIRSSKVGDPQSYHAIMPLSVSEERVGSIITPSVFVL